MIKPGEIYRAEFPGMEPHPVVVVSREELNRGEWVVAVIFTSTRFDARCKLPNCVPFRAGQFGLTKDCVAQAETIFALRKSRLKTEEGLVGTLDDEAMRDLTRAIGNVIAAECEPE